MNFHNGLTSGWHFMLSSTLVWTVLVLSRQDSFTEQLLTGLIFVCIWQEISRRLQPLPVDSQLIYGLKLGPKGGTIVLETKLKRKIRPQLITGSSGQSVSGDS